MAVTIPNSAGYAGDINATEWAQVIPHAGVQYGVLNESSWVATVGASDREVRLSPGTGFGGGIMDRSTATASLVLPASSSGSVYHLIYVHRDWNLGQSAFTSKAGSAVKAIPSRDTTVGQADDQPLWLARVDAGKSQVQELIDLRVWRGYAVDDLVRQYLNELGTNVRIGGREWSRDLDVLGAPTWVDRGIGRLLSTQVVPWDSMAASGSVSDPGVTVWNEASRLIARLNLTDPGVPYRVEIYGHGFWGRELESRTARFDFDAMVGGTAIYTRYPAGDEFLYSNYRSWSPPPSTQVFTGAQQIGLRARRVSGDGFGALKAADSLVVVSIYSA